MITTGTGDCGSTDFLGTRLRKSSLVIDVLGTADELNAYLSKILLTLHMEPSKQLEMIAVETLERFTRGFYKIFAVNTYKCDLAWLEVPQKNIESAYAEWFNRKMQVDLNDLPKNLLAAEANICRTICRRLERLVWRLIDSEETNPYNLSEVSKFLNRASDLLFVVYKSLNDL